MQLPSCLQQAIDQFIQTSNTHELIEAREELTKRYRHSPHAKQFMTTDNQRYSYIISRLPATFAALQKSFQAIRERGQFMIRSVLDLGAGPGTGSWAACGNFSDIEQITLIEKDSFLSSIGQQLIQMSQHPMMKKAKWLEQDLEKIEHLPSHDLVILSYCMGELNPLKIKGVLNDCWQATQQLLLIVEPGTPAGFERIRFMRQHLMDQHAHLIAPCPHLLTCPMSKEDWCHFAARVERTSLHRRLKGGTLGYEDEKFSYLVAAKTGYPLPNSRILSCPSRHCGHVKLKLCTSEGLQYPTISKKTGELYKQARKAEWGDTLSLDCISSPIET